MTGASGWTEALLPDYGQPPLDEAIDPSGAVRTPYRPVLSALGALGPDGLAGRVADLEAARAAQGIVFTAHIDGRPQEQVFPLDPVPRLIGPDTWKPVRRNVPER